MFIFGYAMTWGPGVWIIIGETFPTRTRAKQAALATAANWLWNFLIAFFTPFIVGDIKYAYGFVFAGCNLAGVLVVYFFLYESSALSLEGVDQMYTDTACKPWTSRAWAPEGYANRADLIDQTRAAEAHKPLAGATAEHREKHSQDAGTMGTTTPTGTDGGAPVKAV
jgi:MFS transporter, SP family, sugar:H+ symporter